MDITRVRKVVCSVLFLLVPVLSDSRLSYGEDDEIDLFVANSLSIEKFCCSMEVEFVEDVAKVQDSSFRTQTFVCCVDRQLAKVRYDYLPDFDSREPDRIVAGAATYFVDKRIEIVVMNSRSLQPSTVTFAEAKNLKGTIRFCDPFMSIWVGGSGFFDTSVSELATDRQSTVLARFVFDERREDPKRDVVRYKISRESPVFGDVTFSKEVGEMPIRFKMLRLLPDGKFLEIGKREVDWRKLGNDWVPVSLKSTTTSNGGGPAKGGYAILCSVKYTWTTKLPDKLWLTGEKSEELLQTRDLVDYVHMNTSKLR
ncbi:MAG: hypothetical protein ACK52L_02645 [Pirellula sp.]